MKKLKKTLRQWIAVATAVCTVFTAYLSVGSISANASETTNASETELSNFSLSDFSNWKKGIYQNGGGFDTWSAFLSTKEFLKVTAGDVYKISCSESSYVIVFAQYDENFELVDFDNTISDGAEIIIEDGVSYCGISIYNPSDYAMTYEKYKELFESGFTISQKKLTGYKTEASYTNLNNPGLWRRGLVSFDGSKIFNYTSYINLRNEVTVNPNYSYTYKTNVSSLRLIINEMDKNGNVINNLEAKNGDTLIFNKNTKSLVLSAYNASDYTMTLGMFRSYMKYGVYTLSLSSTALVGNDDTPVVVDPVVDDKPKQEENETHEDELKVSELPLESLNANLDWVYGGFDSKGKIADISDTMRLNSYYTFFEESKKVNICDSTLRLKINEYDSNFNFIRCVDLGNGDYFTKLADTKYVTYSMYQYKDEKTKENTLTDLKNLLTSQLTFTTVNLDEIKENPEELLGEVHIGSLSNSSNYRQGHYKSWGLSYETYTGVYCTRNKYSVTPGKEYYVNVNDSRILISIAEFDKDGKAIRYVDHLTNGSKYVASSNASYIGLNFNSSVWGVDCLGLLDVGMTIDINSKFYCTGVDKVDISQFDFSDFTNYNMGSFSATGFNVSANCLACSKYLDVSKDKGKYRVNLDNHNLRMTIVEYKNDGSYVKTNSYQSGEMWTVDEQTDYIGVYVKSNVGSFSETDYRNQFNSNQKLSLEKFEKYEHNTAMNPITATEFMNTMNVGWNLGNSLDSHYGDRSDNGAPNQETTWGNIVITEDLIEYVKEQGFNTIRIPVTWYYNTYTDDNGNLKVRQEWLERVQTVLDYAIKNDMYVILNTHHEQPIIYAGTTEEKFNQVCKDAKALWSEIASYFGDYDEHLIFESYNEVDNVALSWNYSDKAASQMNTLNQIFVDTVRGLGGNNTNRLLVVPTLLDGRESSFLDSFVLPTDQTADRLIVEVHDYSTAFDQDINSLFEPLSKFSKKINTPVIIGEFGTKPSYVPAEYRVNAASNYVARASEYGLKCVYWDDGNQNNYGLVNRVDYSKSNTDMLSALVNASSYLTSNKTVYNSMDSFKWQTLNQKTGELKDDKYWGTLTTDINGKGISIPEDSDYLTVLLSITGDYYQARVHYVHFYDEKMNVIQTNNSSTGYKMVTYVIPEGAKYVRVGINNSYMACKEAKFKEYLDSGLLSLTIGFVNTEDKSSYVKAE